MKILYDHQIYEHQRIGGISRYFTEIIKHLPAEVKVDLSIKYSFNEYLKGTNICSFEFVDQLQNKIFPGKRFKGQSLITNFLEKIVPQRYPNRYLENKDYTIKKIKEGDFDIFHPTFFDDYYLDIIKDKPFVLTVHDMILELYPEFTYSLGFVKRKKKLVDKASHIIAVSKNTKQDLINVFNVDPDKISVIYHASSLEEKDSNIVLPQRYILYVGDRRLGYKNFSFFITSLIPVLHKYKDVDIFCVGNQFNKNEKYFFEALGLENRIKQRYIADEDMYIVYNRAEMFVYPSYYEGFGIPILESFQAKCPAILADSSCFREVAENAALYFSPKSPKKLRENVELLLNNKAIKYAYTERENKRLKDFTWEKSAKQTFDIYKKVLGK